MSDNSETQDFLYNLEHHPSAAYSHTGCGGCYGKIVGSRRIGNLLHSYIRNTMGLRP